MRTPNSKCEICGKEKYRRPFELKKAKHICCRECRSELYKKYKNYDEKGLEKGHGWNKGMSKAKGDKLIYGKLRSKETKLRISKALKGRIFTEQHKKKISKARIKLFDKIGRIGKSERGYLYARWKRAICKRDDYKCQNCESNKKINAHHIKSWKDYPKLRFKLNNGITLCNKCHKAIHKNKTSVAETALGRLNPKNRRQYFPARP